MWNVRPFSGVGVGRKVRTVAGGLAALLFASRLAAANLPPVANPDSATTPAGIPAEINVTANDTDPDGNPVVLITSPIIVAPTNGVAVKLSGATIRYTPNAGFSGTDTFQYEIGDGQGGRSRAWVTVTVVGNRAPTCNPDSASTTAGASVDVPVTNNDSDPDGDTVTLITSPVVVAPANGTATKLSGTTIRYAPNAGFAGPSDSFQYEAGDGRGARCRTTVTISFPVTNRAPTCNGDAATTNAGVSVDIPVTNNDTDPDGDPVTLVTSPVVVAPANGTAARVSATTIRYTPNAGFNGPSDSFQYEAGDGRGGRCRATVSVTVQATTGTPRIEVLRPDGSPAVASPSYRLLVPYARTTVSAQATFRVRNTGTAALSLGTPTMTRRRGSDGTFTPTLGATLLQPNQETTLAVRYSAAESFFGDAFEEVEIALPNSSAVSTYRFGVTVLWEMHFPDQGLKDLARAIPARADHEDLSNWRGELNHTLDVWSEGGRSANKPTIAAAIALYVQPVVDGTDYVAWWGEFLNRQVGGRPGSSRAVDFLKGEELMSLIYDGSVVTSVMAAYAWTFAGGGGQAFREDAEAYLRATWGAYALSAGRSYVENAFEYNKDGTLLTQGLQRSGNDIVFFDGPYLPLSSMRASNGHWGADDRAMLFCRAVGLSCTTSAVSPESRGQRLAVEAIETALGPFTDSNLYGLSASERKAIVSLFSDDADAGVATSLLGSARAVTPLSFLGWPGVRLTVMASNLNSNTAPTLAAAYYFQPFRTAGDPNVRRPGREAHFLYPFTNHRNVGSGQTAVLDLARSVVCAVNGTTYVEMPVPSGPPLFHVVLGRNGLEAPVTGNCVRP